MPVETAFTGLHIRGRTYCPGATTALISRECRLKTRPRRVAERQQGRNTDMGNLSRRSVLRNSLGLAAAGTLARPYIANAAATTAEVWFAQGFAKEEDAALKKMVADYEK